MSKRTISTLTTILAVSLLLLVPMVIQASPVGTFSLAGLRNVRIGGSFIDWGSVSPPAPATFESATYSNCVSGPNPGACVIDGTTTGSVIFTGGTGAAYGLIAGLNGTLIDLEDDFAPAGPGGFTLNNFLAGIPNISFTANMMPFGTGTLAGCTNTVGDVCTVPGSPFTITNLAGGASSVAMTIQGLATDSTDLVTLPFSGRFTTQFGVTSAGLLASIAANGWVQSSYSADFEVTITTEPVPEPSSAVLVGLGGLLLVGRVAFGRRRNQK